MSYLVVTVVVNLICPSPFSVNAIPAVLGTLNSGTSIAYGSNNTSGCGCACTNSSSVDFTDDEARVVETLKGGGRAWKLGRVPKELLLNTFTKYSVGEKP